MSFPTLETGRILLREIVESDADALHAAYGNPEAMRFWDFPATRSVAETAALIKSARSGGRIRHGVWASSNAAGRLLG
jgi:ribosomal-protein-alanine N-acetyltransferase